MERVTLLRSNLITLVTKVPRFTYQLRQQQSMDGLLELLLILYSSKDITSKYLICTTYIARDVQGIILMSLFELVVEDVHDQINYLKVYLGDTFVGEYYAKGNMPTVGNLRYYNEINTWIFYRDNDDEFLMDDYEEYDTQLYDPKPKEYVLKLRDESDDSEFSSDSD